MFKVIYLIFIHLSCSLFSNLSFSNEKSFYFHCCNKLISFKEKNEKVYDLGWLSHYNKPQWMGKKDNFFYFIFTPHPENPNHEYRVERIELSPKIRFVRSHVQIHNKQAHDTRKENAKHNPHSILNPKKYKTAYNPSLLELIPYRLKRNERAFCFDRDHCLCEQLSYTKYLLKVPGNILWQILSAG